MPSHAYTVICGTCPHRAPVPTRQKAVASALQHQAQHPGHVMVVKIRRA